MPPRSRVNWRTRLPRHTSLIRRSGTFFPGAAFPHTAIFGASNRRPRNRTSAFQEQGHAHDAMHPLRTTRGSDRRAGCRCTNGPTTWPEVHAHREFLDSTSSRIDRLAAPGQLLVLSRGQGLVSKQPVAPERPASSVSARTSDHRS